MEKDKDPGSSAEATSATTTSKKKGSGAAGGKERKAPLDQILDMQKNAVVNLEPRVTREKAK